MFDNFCLIFKNVFRKAKRGEITKQEHITWTKLWGKEKTDDLKVIEKLVVNRRIPDSPLPTQGGHVPVSGLTGFVYILSFHFYLFHKSQSFHTNPNRIPLNPDEPSVVHQTKRQGHPSMDHPSRPGIRGGVRRGNRRVLYSNLCPPC